MLMLSACVCVHVFATGLSRCRRKCAYGTWLINYERLRCPCDAHVARVPTKHACVNVSIVYEAHESCYAGFCFCVCVCVFVCVRTGSIIMLAESKVPETDRVANE